MPSYRTHLIIGFISYVAIVSALPPSYLATDVIIEGLLSCLIGSLFPDIDTKSNGQKIFYSLWLALLIYLVFVASWFLVGILAIIGILPLLSVHRGIFHSICFLIALGCIGVTIALKFELARRLVLCTNTLFFVAGCMSHVFADRFLTSLKRFLR